MRFFRCAFVACSLLLAAAPSFGESYPRGPVAFLVPYAPGGTADIVARLIGAKMQERLGQAVVIENRSGGSEKIATEALVCAPPDGQTIAILSNALAINQVTEPRPKYDGLKDLVPVCRDATQFGSLLHGEMQTWGDAAVVSNGSPTKK